MVRSHVETERPFAPGLGTMEPGVLGRIRRPSGYRLNVDGRQAVVIGASEGSGCSVFDRCATVPPDMGTERTGATSVN